LPAVVFEQKLINSAEKSVLYCAVLANSLPEALELEARITNLPAVGSVDSMARYLAEDQTASWSSSVKSSESWRRFDSGNRHRPCQRAGLSRTLWILHGYFGLAMNEIEQDNKKSGKSENKELYDNLKSLRQAIEHLRQRMFDDLPQAAKKLAAFQQALFSDLRDTFDALKNQDNRDRLRAEDLPPALRHRFVSKSGRLYLLQVYPRDDVWQREKQEEFVAQLRKIDPNVTGTPVQLYEYTTLLKNSYVKAACIRWPRLPCWSSSTFVQLRA